MGDASLSLAGTAMAAAEGYASYKRAATNAELENAVKEINNQQVYESMLSTYQSLEVQADQVDEAYIANSIDQQKAEARSRGTAIASSGASGTGGSGLDMQLQEVSTEGSMNTARMQMNRDRQMASIKSQGDDAFNVANQRFNRMPDQKAPSALAAGLNIGMNGFRNTTELFKLRDAYDDNFGVDEGSSFNTEDLYDAPVNQTDTRIA